MAHVLVIANETAASPALIEALKDRAAALDDVYVTVIAPVSEPRKGYVVYEDTRRASARRRLEKTLELLRDSAVRAQGFVVESGPVQAAKDALVQLEPPPDEIVVSTHSEQHSSWLRRDVVADITKAAGGIPVKHVLALEGTVDEKNVLVVANETVLSKPLLDRIYARAATGPASFLIVAPQSDDVAHLQADRRLRRLLSELRSNGIDAHGQVVHPDPFTATLDAIQDERIDEIIISTFPSERSGWLRRDLIERLQHETNIPIEHVISH